ncbi:MAG: GDP-mannose 4,6-dehydratase, partial [Deltaproteobacteria bacterium]|nr:GDP-mannose 4,6-dehydratase [Deltaproteobacteria bacterium]
QYGLFREDNPLKPNSPYSATKAGADLLARAYFETYELPVLIVRPSNNYGPYQYPEKFIPLMIANLMEDHRVPIYGKGLNVRDWIFVTDTCQAISAIFEKGKPGQAYNVGGESEKRNIDVAQDLLHLFNKDESSLEFVTDRPGHDLRYALDNAKIRTELKWAPVTKFEKGIRETVAWYQANEWWWKPLKERLSKESKGFWSGS